MNKNKAVWLELLIAILISVGVFIFWNVKAAQNTTEGGAAERNDTPGIWVSVEAEDVARISFVSETQNVSKEAESGACFGRGEQLSFSLAELYGKEPDGGYLAYAVYLYDQNGGKISGTSFSDCFAADTRLEFRIDEEHTISRGK